MKNSTKRHLEGFNPIYNTVKPKERKSKKKEKRNKFLIWVFVALFLFVLIEVLLSGCVTEKHRQRICNTCPVTIKDSISYKETVVKHDTTIYITTDPLIISVPSKCPEQKFDIKKRVNGISEEIKSDGITITAICKDDSLERIIEGMVKEKTIYKSENKTEIKWQYYPETFKQTLYKYWSWLTWIILLLFAGYTGVRLWLKSKIL